MDKPPVKLTKKVIDNADKSAMRFILWDSELKGFGIRIEPTGTKTFLLRYRAKGLGREGAKQFYSIGRFGVLTVDEARYQAKNLLGKIALGEDPSQDLKKQKQNVIARRNALNFEQLSELFLTNHMGKKRKQSTKENYEIVLKKHAYPSLGILKAHEITYVQVSKLHQELSQLPATANRLIAIISSIYNYAKKEMLIDFNLNPAQNIEKYREEGRERYLSSEELTRLGNSLNEAEELGLPWRVDETKPPSKHLPKNWATLRQPIDKGAVMAIRLLLFTGARLREILNLRWQHVDMERGLLFLPDSKTGKKTVVLSQSALAIIEGLRVEAGNNSQAYVIKGDVEGKPKADLKRPWKALQIHAELEGVRLHDLRHTFASVGAGSSLGLPIVGKLLGHSQPQTTARYAHLDADPLKRATDIIGAHIAAALDKGRV
jgi:integrase